LSAVDLLPETPVAKGQFLAPPRSRRIAWLVLVYVNALTIVFVWRVSRSLAMLLSSFDLVMVLFIVGVAFLGFVVRSSRLRVDADGVHWGWELLGFRIRKDKLACARVYRDAVAVVPRRGFPWYLSARDWHPWPAVLTAFRQSGLPLQTHDRRAPLRAKLQGYGLFLDTVLILSSLVLTTLLFTS
jgi:hypothetical protein